MYGFTLADKATSPKLDYLWGEIHFIKERYPRLFQYRDVLVQQIHNICTNTFKAISVAEYNTMKERILSQCVAEDGEDLEAKRADLEEDVSTYTPHNCLREQRRDPGQVCTTSQNHTTPHLRAAGYSGVLLKGSRAGLHHLSKPHYTTPESRLYTFGGVCDHMLSVLDLLL